MTLTQEQEDAVNRLIVAFVAPGTNPATTMEASACSASVIEEPHSTPLEELLMPHAIPSLNEEPGQVLFRIINEWKRATEVVRGMNNQPAQHAITRAINAEAGLEISEGKLALATRRVVELTSELHKRNTDKPQEITKPRLMEGMIIEADPINAEHNPTSQPH